MHKEEKKRFLNKEMIGIILGLAWPTMLEQLMQTTVQYIDTAMVGSLGTHATAAVGATTTINWLLCGTISAIGEREGFETIIVNFRGGPVGLKNIAVSVGEEEDSIEEVYEPFLIQKGLLTRTPKGRVATPKAWRKLGLKSPGSQGELF